MDRSENEKRLRETRQYWDAAAAQFDEEPDHGLRDPAIRQAWADLLMRSLPLRQGRVLDIGCGTGSLSVLLVGLGFEVTGIDLSPEMIALAETKAKQSRQVITFQVMDAAGPQFPPQQFDAIICRHLLWALPDPGQVLQRWADLVKPGGSLLLIEGFWHTGAGLHVGEIVAVLP
ncbi:MAG: class I SAM-dependent methyltransferase, partial [Chloroflexi bacterium]